MEHEIFSSNHRRSFVESDLKIYARVIWRWLWLVLLCMVVAGGAAYMVSSISTPIYQASSTLLIDRANTPDGSTYTEIIGSERIAKTYAGLMALDATLENVAHKLGIEPAVLESDITNISVTPQRDTQLVEIVVEGVSPSLSMHVANELPNVFIEEINKLQTERFAEPKENLKNQLEILSNEIELIQIEIDSISDSPTRQEELNIAQRRSELTQYQASYANMLQSYEALRLTEIQAADSVVVVQQAKAPETFIRPRTLVNTLLAIIVGAMMALGLIFLVEYLDERVKSPQDLVGLLNIPFLGAVSIIRNKDERKFGMLITATEPRNPISEAYRGLRTNLQFSSVDMPLRSLVVTSAQPQEGKTTTAANLAVVMAQAGHKVILIDADMRKPSQHRLFDVPKAPGLTDALLAAVQPEPQHTFVENLRLIPSGKIPPNPSELLGSQRMRQLLDDLQSAADIVIIDAPPLLPVTDAQVLSTQVDGTLLLVNAGINRSAVIRAVEALDRVNARLLGLAFNRLTKSSGDYYYSYDYYYVEDEESVTPRSRRRSTPAAYQDLNIVGNVNGFHKERV